MDADLDDLHVGSIVPIEVEAFGEDEDGRRYFFWHQSMRHNFFSHLASLMQEHPRVVGYPTCLGDSIELCGLIFMFEEFGRVV